MSIDQLAPRILTLPADVRAALARVDGPGWCIYQDGRALPATANVIGLATGAWAWFPANPAASVAAVTGYKLYRCYSMIASDLPGDCGPYGDFAAALSIIEAHVAGRSSNG